MINEWKSISDDVLKLSEIIFNRLLDDSKKMAKTIGRITSIPFKRGEFTINNEMIIGDISVRYTVYECGNNHDYDYLVNNSILNCSADNEDNSINISCARIGNEFIDDVVSDIAHEVNHLYQYSNGMQKKVDLYDRAMLVINNDYLSSIGRYVGYLLYYTFKHEQDSFVTQFYYYIKQNDSKCEHEFNAMCNDYQVYQTMTKCLSKVKQNKDHADVKRALSVVGMDYSRWKLRVENGIKRFERKLMNVYHRHMIETRRGKTIEGIVKRQLSLLERYDIINEEIEPQFSL